MNMIKQKYFVIALGVIVLIGIAFAARNILVKKPFVITSADKEATLTISPDALPEGVSLKDVSIAKESVKNFFDIERNEEMLTAYKLLPDGLKLTKPAKITLASAYAQRVDGKFAVPLIFHKSGNNVELVENTTIDMTDEGKMVLLSGEISHFSWVLHSPDGIFFIRLEPYSVTLPIGDVVPVSVTIDHKPPRDEIRDGRALFALAPDTSWRVNADNNKHYLYETGAKLQPRRVNLPSQEIKGPEGVYRAEENLTCKQPGFSTLSLRGGIVLDYTLLRIIPTWEKQPNGKFQREDVMPEKHVVINDVFSTYLYECIDSTELPPPPSADVRSSEETPAPPASAVPGKSGGVIKVCGLPGGEPCPRR